MPDAFAFAGYPAPFIHETPDGKRIQQLIWGDFVNLLGEDDGPWTKVRARGETGWMKTTHLQEERLLEVNFVDIGQGDGAFIVTPQDRFILVDAGESDNMVRFLSWRFNLRKNSDRVVPIERAVISHPDQDHYKGFDPLFKSFQFRFDAVYHNGIVERVGDDSLGPRVDHNGLEYLADVITDFDSLKEFLAVPGNVGGKQYPKLLKKAVDEGRVAEIRALSAQDRFLPGYGDGQDLKIEILAPVPETVNGKPALRWFDDVGKTKNGHSVVLRMVYKHVRILLGGDLNVPAEEYLLEHYTGLDPKPADEQSREALIGAARRVFEADVAKACHHGSADFTDLYLCAVTPLATVISSGDNEQYAHPRPDALGAFGKCGRGPRPLLFSTELARSARENIKEPRRLQAEIRQLFDERENAQTAEARAAINERIDDVLALLERSIAVYGLINLRTDGKRVLLAQKLERRAGSGQEWDVHRLEPDETGALGYVPKH